ncbi:MAG: peptidase domain protein, partial [Verrucomicrobiaceae bacterium]|nr:peptidase domain protein [Verrucomicrobiaceae bacterium]
MHSAIFRPLRICLLALGTVVLMAPAWAAYPTFSTTKPNGALRGTESQLIVTGTQLQDFEGFIFMSPGFTLKSVDKVTPTAVTTTIAIAPEVPLGNHMIRIRTKTGVSHARQFFVGRYPNVEEKEPNDDFNAPQIVGFNQTIEGIVKSEDVDYYRLSAKKGQRIAIEIDGLRLGYTNFDPYIAILDKGRFELGASDDTILHRQDGYVSIKAPEDGDYTIMVRESSYRGDNSSYYRLHIGSFNRPDVVYPAGGKVGSTLKVRFIEKAGDTYEEDVKVPAELDPDFMLLPKTHESPPSGNPFRIVNFDNVMEAEPNDTVATATVSAGNPVALNGVIDKPGDVDFFKVPLTKGMKLEVQAFAQALGSPLDSVVSLLNEKGVSLSNNDDGGGRRRLDSKFAVTIPADGNYYIRVTDHLERGGPAYVYRIEMSASEPSVKFSSPNYSVNDSHMRQFIAVPRGGRYATVVNVTRTAVSADMKFEMPGLPAGVKLLTSTLSKDLSSINLLFEAASDAPLAGAAVPLTLASLDPAQKVTGYLNQEFDIVRNGNVVYYTEIEDKLP